MKPYRFSVLEARLDDLKYEIIDELSWISGCRRDLVVRRIRGVKAVAAAPKDGGPGCIVVRLSKAWHKRQGRIRVVPSLTARESADILRRGMTPPSMRVKNVYEGVNALGWRINW